MKNRIGTASLVLALILVLTACSGGGGGSSTTNTPSTASLISITVTPTSPTIPKGVSKQFSAVGFYSDNTSHDITTSVSWDSSDSSKATVDTFGRATGVAAGTSTITASQGAINGTATLTITSATLVSMTVTPASPSIAKGTSQQFSVIGIFSDNTLQDLTGQVTWSSSDSAKATIGNNGIATGVAAGSTTISATSGSTSATATLSVTNATLLSLAVTPVNPAAVAGATQQFTAMGTFSDGTAQDLSTQVAWTSSDTSKATINTSGLATAVAEGTSTITAKSGNSTASAGLTVTAAPTNAPPAGSVQLSGTVQADPGDPSANGQQSGATVYVVGQQNSGTTTDSNGNFTLYVNPQLSGTVLASPGIKRGARAGAVSRVATGTQTLSYGIIVVDSNDSHGVKSDVLIVTDQTNTCPTLYINTVGSIAGHAFLQGASDHSGITVYLPGTSFSAITAADGSYTISGVPSGTYNFLRAEKFGTTYHYAIQSGVTVTTTQTTTVPDMTLQLSTGAFGGIIINDGDVFTNNKDVILSIAPSSDAVLMSISSDPTFVGAQWVPVQSTMPFSFPAPFPAGGQTVSAYIKFAQESGLASEPTMTSIYLDTNPQATMVAPVSLTMSQTPTLQWAYAPPMPNPQYHVQLSLVSNFSSTVAEANNLSATQYTVPTTLPEGTYYWRVAIMYNGTELAWGPTWSFDINRNAGSPLTPTNTSYVNNTTPQFTWSPNAAASSYGFVLSTNSNLASPVISATNIIGSSYGPISSLPTATSTPYFWAITPYDSLGNPGTRSGVMEFTLDTVAPSGSITINNNDTFTAVTSVTLNLAASDADKVAAYVVSENPSTPSLNDTHWVTVTPTASLSTNPTFTLSSSSGVKTVYAWFKDSVGNISSAYSDSINLLDFTPNFQTIDQGGNGGFPSIAYAPGAGVNIVYIDEMNNSGIKYLTNYTGSWSWPTFLDTSSIVQTGADHSLATHYFNFNWTLHMVYSDGYSHTYYLYKPGMIRSTWQAKVTVDTAPNSKSYNLPSVAVDSNNKAHVAYVGNDFLKYADNTAGSWATYTIDSTANVYGQSISIGVDSNDKVYISYLDSTNQTVKCISNVTGTWVATAIDSVGFSYGATSLAIGSANSVHIAYNTYSGYLKYATNSLGSWTTTTIGSSTSFPMSLAADTTTNAAYISYYYGGLRLATNAFGPWATAGVDSSAFPYQSSIAVNGVSPPYSVHMVYFNVADWSLRYTFANY
jgi:uncharacterized protein YjdB